MLPFRRRPPTFSSNEFKEKRQQQQQQESKDEILTGGGLVQRAIEQDLLELLPEFLERLKCVVSSPTHPHEHVAEGDVFVSFKQVFRQAKVALLHTRTIPPRCDRGSYAQLLYASCLSLLKRSFHTAAADDDNDDTMVFENAMFSVFCLYAMQETNLLPAEPSSPLQMLPMGLQHPDNAKLLYRRTFWSPIRIDRHHYSLLQRLRDEALARRADCQSRRMNCWSFRTSSTCNDMSDAWTCTCNGALDVVQVLDRLMPKLDLVEYTGPAGLEALAGHADYPYGCVRPKRGNDAPRFAVPMSLTSPRLSHQELDTIAAVPLETQSLCNLDVSMKRYKDKIKEIHRRVTVDAINSKQAARVRDALKPIFGRQSELSTSENEVGTRSDSGNHRLHAQTASAESQAKNIASHEPLESLKDERFADDALRQTSQTNKLADLGIQLVLPSDLTELQREGIHAALNSAIEMGDTLIKHTVETSASARLMAGSSHSKEVDEESSHGSLSDASSHSSRQGAAALRHLLSKVSAGSRGANNGIPAATAPRNHDTAATVFGTLDFLTMDSEDLQVPDSSDESSTSSAGMRSSASVDRMSLQSLWSTVGEKEPSWQRRRKRKRRSSSVGKCTHTPEHALRSLSAQKRSTDDSEHFGESPVDSEASSVDMGRDALQALISTVEKDNGDPMNHPRRRTTRKGKQNVSRSSQPPTAPTSRPRVDSEHSSASSLGSEASSVDMGRDAMKTLLSTVRVDESGPANHRQLPKEGVSQRRLLSGMRKRRVARSRQVRHATARMSPWSDDEHSSESTVTSGGSSVDVGRDAMKALLSTVCEDAGDSEADDGTLPTRMDTGNIPPQDGEKSASD